MRYGNLMLTSHDTNLPAKSLIKMFYIIFICVDTMPPRFLASYAIWNWTDFCILNLIIYINMGTIVINVLLINLFMLFWLYWYNLNNLIYWKIYWEKRRLKCLTEFWIPLWNMPTFFILFRISLWQWYGLRAFTNDLN